MGKHVVHLASDAPALGVSCSLGAQLLLGLQLRRTLAQRSHELALRPDEEPPADHYHGEQHT
jgi:hypothetical protein